MDRLSDLNAEIREPVEIRAIPVAVSADVCILSGAIRSLGKPEKAGYRRGRRWPLRCAEPEYRPCENPERVYGLVIGLRFATLCMWLEAMFRVVSSDKVVYLFGKVSPLLSLFLTILLRLIPRIGQEARRINLAQKGIGRGSNQGNIFRRFVNCLRIFSMLITWMISALALESDSMRSRGSLLRGRTAFSIYRFDNRDRAFVIALFSCITLTAMGVILGASKMWYNPRIIWRPLNGIGVMTAIGYLALCFMPMALELWTEYRFRKAREK